MPHALDADATDTYPCPKCGYDLRGQTDDPVRCPECGGVWPLDACRVSDADLEERVRDIKTGVVFGAVLTAIVILATVGMSIALSSPNQIAFIGIGLGISFSFVCVIIGIFRDACASRPGWMTLGGGWLLVTWLRAVAILSAVVFPFSGFAVEPIIIGLAALAASIFLDRVLRPRFQRVAREAIITERAATRPVSDA